MRAYLTLLPETIENNYQISIYSAARPNKHLRKKLQFISKAGLNDEIIRSEIALREVIDDDSKQQTLIDRVIKLSEIRLQLVDNSLIIIENNDYILFISNKPKLLISDIEELVKKYFMVSSIKWKRARS